MSITVCLSAKYPTMTRSSCNAGQEDEVQNSCGIALHTGHSACEPSRSSRAGPSGSHGSAGGAPGGCLAGKEKQKTTGVYNMSYVPAEKWDCFSHHWLMLIHLKLEELVRKPVKRSHSKPPAGTEPSSAVHLSNKATYDHRPSFWVMKP